MLVSAVTNYLVAAGLLGWVQKKQEKSGSMRWGLQFDLAGKGANYCTLPGIPYLPYPDTYSTQATY